MTLEAHEGGLGEGFHDEDSDAPITQNDLGEWIRILRRRSHRHANALMAHSGDLLLERMRIDESLKDIGRVEGRAAGVESRLSDLENFRAATKGAMAVLVLLFPATVGVIVAVLA